MNRRRPPGRPLLLAISLCLLAAACTDQSAGEEPTDEALPPGAQDVAVDGSLDQLDLAGSELWIGSPEDDSDDATDQLLMWITVEALEVAGATVTAEEGLGSGFLLRDSLLAGEIDLYWEGAGAAWTAILREPAGDLGADVLHERLAVRDRLEHGVVWLRPAGFHDSRGFAVASEMARDSGILTLGDMAEHLRTASEDPTVCVTSSFLTFPDDGRVDFEETLDVTLPEERLREYDPVPIYPDTARRTCQFGEVHRTSGRIPQYGLHLLEDDAGVFLANPPALAVREDVVEAHPELVALGATLAEHLTTEVVQELNRRVVVDGEEPRSVAEDWLHEVGLTE